eukprot:7169776-Prymnesium_polylepis.4
MRIRSSQRSCAAVVRKLPGSPANAASALPSACSAAHAFASATPIAFPAVASRSASFARQLSTLAWALVAAVCSLTPAFCASLRFLAAWSDSCFAWAAACAAPPPGRRLASQARPLLRSPTPPLWQWPPPRASPPTPWPPAALMQPDLPSPSLEALPSSLLGEVCSESSELPHLAGCGCFATFDCCVGIPLLGERCPWQGAQTCATRKIAAQCGSAIEYSLLDLLFDWAPPSRQTKSKKGFGSRRWGAL